VSPAAIVAQSHVQRVTTMRRTRGDWQPPRLTHDWSLDHRRIAIWARAKERTQRRALLLLAALDSDLTPRDELVRLERLMAQANALAERIP
jgi:hypothetical protein